MKHRTELLRLLSALCDERLTESEQVRLEELLGDHESRQLYLQYLDMHARLLTHPAAGGESQLPGVDALAGLLGDEARAVVAPRPLSRSSTPRAERYRGRSLQALSYVAVAAATLAATILVQLAFSKQRRPATSPASVAVQQTYVATLSQAVDAEWGPATEAYRTGARVLSGDFSLRKGLVRLAYEGGVELIVQGPADLRLESGSAATLLTGKIVFRADDASAPFTLSTPSSILVDIG